MQTKLTLRMDDKLIERAKRYAKRRETSVSQLVADYFAILDAEAEFEEGEAPPIVDALRGALKQVDVEPADLRREAGDRYL